MAYTNAQKVMFGTYMLSEEAEYLWNNDCWRLEAGGIEFNWEKFKCEFLDK